MATEGSSSDGGDDHWVDDHGVLRSDPVLASWWFTHYAHRQFGEHHSEVDSDASQFFMRLRRASDILATDIRGVEGTGGPSSAGQRILLTLDLCGSLTQAAISDFSGMSKAAVSSAVRTLVADGLVSRSRSVDDGRAVQLQLTDLGRSTQRELFLRRNQRESSWMDALTKTERALFAGLLEKLMNEAARREVAPRISSHEIRDIAKHK